MWYNSHDQNARVAALFRFGGRAVQMPLTIETDVEDDGRWIAEVIEIPGALAYGPTCETAIANARGLAFRVLANQIEHGEPVPDMSDVFLVAA